MRERPAGRISPLASLLCPISMVYGWAMRLRATCYRKSIFRTRELPCAVVSVGNITTGGTGKTPMTIYLAKLLTSLGYAVAVISRGYKGRAERAGGIVSDGRRICMDQETAGDEPFMMATKLESVPVVVGRDRYAGGSLAVERFDPDVLVLDDAFQHLRLARDLNLVLLDNRFPFGNGHLLPAGTLREPPSALLRSDAVLITRADRTEDAERLLSQLARSELLEGRPAFRSVHLHRIEKLVQANRRPAKNNGAERSSGSGLESLQGKRAFCFSGVARNDDFRRTVEGLGCLLVGSRAFPDHHSYSDRDIAAMLRLVREAGVDIVLTTEKDYVRVAGKTAWPVDMAVIGLETSFGDSAGGFRQFIEDRLVTIIADKGKTHTRRP